jgi:hypothetical protein
MGWTASRRVPLIDSLVLDGSDTDARLWEIAENLHRADLTVLERSEHIAEWVRLTEEVLAQQPAQVAPPVKKHGHVQQTGGVNAAVRELSIDRTEAQRSVNVSKLPEAAKNAAREAGQSRQRHHPKNLAGGWRALIILYVAMRLVPRGTGSMLDGRDVTRSASHRSQFTLGGGRFRYQRQRWARPPITEISLLYQNHDLYKAMPAVVSPTGPPMGAGTVARRIVMDRFVHLFPTTGTQPATAPKVGTAEKSPRDKPRANFGVESGQVLPAETMGAGCGSVNPRSGAAIYDNGLCEIGPRSGAKMAPAWTARGQFDQDSFGHVARPPARCAPDGPWVNGGDALSHPVPSRAACHAGARHQRATITNKTYLHIRTVTRYRWAPAVISLTGPLVGIGTGAPGLTTVAPVSILRNRTDR